MSNVVNLFDSENDSMCYVLDEDEQPIGIIYDLGDGIVEIYDQQNGKIVIGIKTEDGCAGVFADEEKVKDSLIAFICLKWPELLFESVFYDEPDE